jgi:hypothetical protein
MGGVMLATSIARADPSDDEARQAREERAAILATELAKLPRSRTDRSVSTLDLWLGGGLLLLGAASVVVYRDPTSPPARGLIGTGTVMVGTGAALRYANPDYDYTISEVGLLGFFAAWHADLAYGLQRPERSAPIALACGGGASVLLVALSAAVKRPVAASTVDVWYLHVSTPDRRRRIPEQDLAAIERGIERMRPAIPAPLQMAPLFVGSALSAGFILDSDLDGLAKGLWLTDAIAQGALAIALGSESAPDYPEALRRAGIHVSVAVDPNGSFLAVNGPF